MKFRKNLEALWVGLGLVETFGLKKPLTKENTEMFLNYNPLTTGPVNLEESMIENMEDSVLPENMQSFDTAMSD